MYSHLEVLNDTVVDPVLLIPIFVKALNPPPTLLLIHPNEFAHTAKLAGIEPEVNDAEGIGGEPDAADVISQPDIFNVLYFELNVTLPNASNTFIPYTVSAC